MAITANYAGSSMTLNLNLGFRGLGFKGSGSGFRVYNPEEISMKPQGPRRREAKANMEVVSQTVHEVVVHVEQILLLSIERQINEVELQNPKRQAYRGDSGFGVCIVLSTWQQQEPKLSFRMLRRYAFGYD